jgi:ubiquinone/menaquinone biosynthesis C-methylase UbiE
MRNLVTYFVELPGFLRNPLWLFFHNLILRVDNNGSAVFLNYGYAANGDEFKHLNLNEEEEYYRYATQLYVFASRNISFPRKDILEVGSGRGGGAAFLCSHFKPNSYTAVDLNPRTIKFCIKRHQVLGLKFIAGDAENLPLNDNSYDAVINVESARCYPNKAKFFKEVYRVLKSKGQFCFTDMIKPTDLAGIEKQIVDAGFVMKDKTDILKNVVDSLRHDSKNRKEEIDIKVHKILRSMFYEFAGVENSKRFEIFKTGEMGYWSYTFERKD